MQFESKIKTIEWVDNKSRMIDQTLLPKTFKTVDITNVAQKGNWTILKFTKLNNMGLN